MSQHATEVATGERFEFGKNWARILQTLNDDKIEEATKSLKNQSGDGKPGGQEFPGYRFRQRPVQPGGAKIGSPRPLL